MTTIEKISKATDILTAEGYRVDHKIMVFSLFQGRNVDLDDIKSFIRIESNCSYHYSPDEIEITFSLSIKKIDGSVNTTKDNRKLAAYINHLCDVVDELNGLHIILKRDLSELGL